MAEKKKRDGDASVCTFPARGRERGKRDSDASVAAPGGENSETGGGIVWAEALTPFPYSGADGKQPTMRIEQGDMVRLPVAVALQYENMRLVRILDADHWPDENGHDTVKHR